MGWVTGKAWCVYERDWKMVCRIRGITDANRRLECKTAVATLQRAPFASRRALQRLDLTKLPSKTPGFHPIWRANISASAGHTHEVETRNSVGKPKPVPTVCRACSYLCQLGWGPTSHATHPVTALNLVLFPRMALVRRCTNSRPPPSQRLRSPLSEIGELEAFREEVRHRGTHHMCPSEV